MRWALSFAALLGCGSGPLPRPPMMAQTTADLAPVPYPPPPARVEAVPAQPRKNATWLDGEWTWRARRWLWIPGRWVLPPPHTFYSPWTLSRAASGRLYVAPGVWRNDKGVAIDPPRALALAQVSEGAVVDSLGVAHAPGRTLRAPGEQAQDQHEKEQANNNP